MTDEEYRKELKHIYEIYEFDLSKALNDRDFAIKILNAKYNNTRGK